MATLTYNKINSFVDDLAEGVHTFATDQLVVALTNTAHNAAWTQLSDLTQVAYTYCSTRNLTTTSSTQTGGTYSLVLQDLTLTATGGSVGPFQYIYVYNDTSTGDKLIGYYDAGAPITLAAGESYLLDFSESQTLLTIA